MQNRELFRQVNERIAEVGGWFAHDGQPLGLICECETVGCTTAIQVPLEVYARVRREGVAYLVALGHEDLEHEEVFETYAGYLIVRARAARWAAREEREAATALRAQARQQVRESRRGRGDGQRAADGAG